MKLSEHLLATGFVSPSVSVIGVSVEGGLDDSELAFLEQECNRRATRNHRAMGFFEPSQWLTRRQCRAKKSSCGTSPCGKPRLTHDWSTVEVMNTSFHRNEEEGSELPTPYRRKASPVEAML